MQPFITPGAPIDACISRLSAEHHAGSARPRFLGALLAALLVFIALVAGATPAHAITRNTVLARAQRWVDVPVPYSQLKYFGGYRTDCSGYVSMSWRTGTSWSTSTFHSVSSAITTADLQPGDAIHRVGHIRLFYGWLDDAHRLYVCYEQTGPTTKSSIRDIADDLASGYHPCRYEHIAESVPGRNLLRNPAFDVWARPWGEWRTEPVWWTPGSSNETTLVSKRQDVARSGNNSAKLLNSSNIEDDYTTLSQEVTVTPETTYALSAWVRDVSDPDGLRFSIDYYDASGTLLARRRTYGDDYSIEASSFSRIAYALKAPAAATRAKVVVRIAGGSTTVGTATVAGTAVTIDDLAFLRPYSAVTISQSRTRATIGVKATMSGVLGASPSVIPTVAAGRPYVLMVMKPGTAAWVPFHDHTTFMSSGHAAWRCIYTFKRGMKKGTYRFKAVVPAFGDFLGCESATASVTLK